MNTTGKSILISTATRLCQKPISEQTSQASFFDMDARLLVGEAPAKAGRPLKILL